MKININHIACGYAKKRVIDDLTLEIASGEIIFVLGTNGVGKSTLFKTLLGFLPALGGDIRIDGVNLKQFTAKQLAKHMAYVPQSKSYTYQYTVFDIVLMGRSAYIDGFSMPSKRDVEIADKAIEELGISRLKEKLYSELSGGEQQCVLIARAIAQESEILIMDEPTANLDLKNQKKLLDVMKVLAAKGKTILLSSHSPEHAFVSSDKVLLLCRDRAPLFGTANEVITPENIYEAFHVKIDILEKKYPDGTTKKAICML